MRTVRLRRLLAVLVATLVAVGIVGDSRLALRRRRRCAITMTSPACRAEQLGLGDLQLDHDGDRATIRPARSTARLPRRAATEPRSRTTPFRLLRTASTPSCSGPQERRPSGRRRRRSPGRSTLFPPARRHLAGRQPHQLDRRAPISFTNPDPSAIAHTCSLDGARPSACMSPWSVSSDLWRRPATRSRSSQRTPTSTLGGSSSVTWLRRPHRSGRRTAHRPRVTCHPAQRRPSPSRRPAPRPSPCTGRPAPRSPRTSGYEVTGLSDGSTLDDGQRCRRCRQPAQPATVSWVVDTVAPPPRPGH